MRMQITFSTLIVVQFLVVTLHDWLDIPGWTHGKKVQAAVGRRKFFLVTLVNAIFPGLAVVFIFLYRHGPRPMFVTKLLVNLRGGYRILSHHDVVRALPIRRRREDKTHVSDNVRGYETGFAGAWRQSAS
jgi:hypothetical protein